MKKTKFYLFFFTAFIALPIFSVLLISCPPLYEVPFDNVVKISGDLTLSKWNAILSDIYSKGNYITLDLSACTPAASDNEVLKRVNENGNDYVSNGNIYDDYIQFNASSGSKDGKEFIRSLILPDVATMINNASDNINIISIGDAVNNETDKYAFKHFTNLRSISGKEIYLIGTFAFYNCQNLTEANLPKIRILMQFSFFNCTSIKNLNFGYLQYIRQSAFEDCSGLERADFKSTLSIEHRAFKNCTSITEVDFPLVKIINPEAFMGCTNLKNVRFAAAEKIGDEAFKNCTKLETAVFLGNPNQVTLPPAQHPLDPWRAGSGLFTADCFVIYDNAFYGCKSLNTLDIRNAWNIYFAGGCLADIGTHLNLYLFDDDGTKSFGHPPIDYFLGGGNGKGPLTLSSLKIYIPQSGTKVEYYHAGAGTGYHGIAVWVDGILSTVSVTIEKLP